MYRMTHHRRRVNMELASFPQKLWTRQPLASSRELKQSLANSPRECSWRKSLTIGNKQILSGWNSRSGKLLQRLNACRARLFKRAPEISRAQVSRDGRSLKIDGKHFRMLRDGGRIAYIARQGKERVSADAASWRTISISTCRAWAI